MGGNSVLDARFFNHPTYKAYTDKNIDSLPSIVCLSPEQRNALRVVACVLPFRTNQYVCQELIDWRNVPADPMFQLTFPQQEMLEPDDFSRIYDLLQHNAAAGEIAQVVGEIRARMNPHPAGQRQQNVPFLNGDSIPGVQRKYKETALFFPSQGQTCHAYCTYCFRWAQFVGVEELRFASTTAEQLKSYLIRETEISDVLFTGGDPLTMHARLLRQYIEPLLTPELAHVQNIRIGTKAVAYWPFRFITDPDADDLMRLFAEIVSKGRHLALMAHYSHPCELNTKAAQEAVRRLRETGCEVRVQAPLVRYVNDNPNTWAELWRETVRVGAIPYYMFVERDTGPKHYFEVPLAEGYEIFRTAYSRVSGLARTVRGPSMSCEPGKVQIDGVAEIRGERVFVLSFLQARNPLWVKRPFFAKFDPKATWLSQLRPAFGESRFFFEEC